MNIITRSRWGARPIANQSGRFTPLNLRNVTTIALHHMGHHNAGIKAVEGWHMDGNKWAGIGYNYWIGFDGKKYEGRGLNVAAGVANQNSTVISIGFQGNYQSGSGQLSPAMSNAQFNAGVDLIRWIQGQVPSAKRVAGHGELAGTACPGNSFPLSEMKTLKLRGAPSASSSAASTQAPAAQTTPAANTFREYLVQVTADFLNIRNGPGTSSSVVGTIRDKGRYTISEDKIANGIVWGRLKSGAGWISLSHTKRV